MSVGPAPANLTPESWNSLFDFLDPARPSREGPAHDAAAASKLIEIRRRLECYFAARGCREAEDLAIETVLRVATKGAQVDRTGFPDATGYFYGVARNVLHEWRRRQQSDEAGRDGLRAELGRAAVPAPDAWGDSEHVHRCLAACLARLGGRDRRLLLGYYGASGAASIAHHKQIAAEAGKSVNSLRIEVHKLRKAVRECLFRQLGNDRPASAM